MFDKIGIQPSNESGNYEFRENSPFITHNSSLLYYRLKMIDLDGSFAFSKIINVGLENKFFTYNIYPNPTYDLLNINMKSDKNEIVTYYLVSLDGKKIASKSFEIKSGNNELNWDISKINSGIYIISDGETIIGKQKIVKSF